MAEKTAAQGARSVDDRSESIFRNIERSGALPQGLRAPEAAGATLCSLSRRLSKREARDLVAALPETLQGIVRPCAAHREEKGEIFGREAFLRTLAQHMELGMDQAEEVAWAVFAAVQREMRADEVTRVESQLPADLRELWVRRLAA